MLAAEWYDQEALLIAYPHAQSDWAPYLSEAEAFFDEFVSIAARYQPVILIAPEGFAKRFANTRIVHLPTNDTWARDFGPITTFSGGKKQLLDFTFNGWGLKYPANHDNQINRRLFGTKKLGFVLEGGAIESDGAGTILTTASCLLEANRNPHMDRHEIEAYLLRTLGAKRMIWLENGYLEGDDTNGHIDMLARFIDPHTILYVSCDDPADPHYEPLKKMEAELRRTGYRLIPLPWVAPKYFDGQRLPASYANFVILNGAVIVPVYGDANDEAAIRLFQRIFGRDIIALNASVLLRQHGSIHCSCCNLYKG